MNIREAVLTDIPWTIEQLKLFAIFSGTKRSAFGDSTYCEFLLKNFVTDHVFLVAEKDDGAPVGFIAGTLNPHPFNPDIITLTELFWWVTEGERSSRAGSMLLDAFVKIGKDKADWVTMCLTSKSPISDKHLLKRGFVATERAYLLEAE